MCSFVPIPVAWGRFIPDTQVTAVLSDLGDGLPTNAWQAIIWTSANMEH